MFRLGDYVVLDPDGPYYNNIPEYFRNRAFIISSNIMINANVKIREIYGPKREWSCDKQSITLISKEEALMCSL